MWTEQISQLQMVEAACVKAIISTDGHLHGVEAWRVVGVCELLPAAGEDLVDGEAAEVVSPQEPVQHVVQHAGGADLAILLHLPCFHCQRRIK